MTYSGGAKEAVFRRLARLVLHRLRMSLHNLMVYCTNGFLVLAFLSAPIRNTLRKGVESWSLLFLGKHLIGVPRSGGLCPPA